MSHFKIEFVSRESDQDTESTVYTITPVPAATDLDSTPDMGSGEVVLPETGCDLPTDLYSQGLACAQDYLTRSVKTSTRYKQLLNYRSVIGNGLFCLLVLLIGGMFKLNKIRMPQVV